MNEIQIFEIQLRKKEKIEALLDLIDKSIPYHIIFILWYKDEFFISVSQKHPHVTNDNHAVIDWSFRSSLDDILDDLCFQISGKQKMSITELIQHEGEIKRLQNEATKLKSAIKKSKQFNEKVELNLKLQEVNERLKKNKNK